MTPDQKFNYLKSIISELTHKAVEQNATIFYDGIIVKSDQILVDETGIFVSGDNWTDSLYQHTPDWDHGWYDSIEDLVHRIKSHFKLFKEIQYYPY